MKRIPFTALEIYFTGTKLPAKIFVLIGENFFSFVEYTCRDISWIDKSVHSVYKYTFISLLPMHEYVMVIPTGSLVYFIFMLDLIAPRPTFSKNDSLTYIYIIFSNCTFEYLNINKPRLRPNYTLSLLDV